MSESAINRILSKVPFPEPPTLTGFPYKDLELLKVFKGNLDIYGAALETLCCKVFSNAINNSRNLADKKKQFKDICSAVEKDLSRLDSGFSVKHVIDLLGVKHMPMRLTKEQALSNNSYMNDAKVSYIHDTKSICVLRLGQEKPPFGIPECPICNDEEKISSKEELSNHIKRNHITFKGTKKKKIENIDFSFIKVEFDRNLKLSNQNLENLNSSINLICQENIPDGRRNMIRDELIDYLHQKISSKIPNCDLLKYGSCSNGFELISSDIDLCLLVDIRSGLKDKKFMKILTEVIGEYKTKELCELIILSNICDVLENERVHDLEKIEGARVRIISFKTPTEPSFSVDICVNRRIVLENTRLLKCYSLIDPRVPRLGVIIKLWAKAQAISDPKNGTLSSYAYVLLTIYYFQHIPHRILPSLQEGNLKKKVIDGFDCSFNDDLRSFGELQHENSDDEGTLLLGFFAFYSNFDWMNNSIDIRSSKFVEKPQKYESLIISIQDPFEIERNLGDVVNRGAADKIINCFKKAYMELVSGVSLLALIEENT